MAKEVTISKEVDAILDKIFADGSITEKTGITKESITKSARVAEQFAYGRMTDLVRQQIQLPDGDKLYFEGSVRVIKPKNEGEPYQIKQFPIETEKTADQKIFAYGAEIYSKEAVAALTQKTSWKSQDGDKRYGPAYANAGRPISIVNKETGEKKSYLLGIHQPTNHVVALPVSVVEDYFKNDAGKKMYGVEFTEGEIAALSSGKCARLYDAQTKDGQTFDCYVQYSPVEMKVVTVHPTDLKLVYDKKMSEKAGEKKENTQAQSHKNTEKKDRGHKI